MKALSHFLALLIALAVLAGAGFAAYLGVEYLGNTFSGFSPWVQITALACAVVLLAASWVSSALRRNARDQLAVPLREAKVAAYRLMAHVWQWRLQHPAEPWSAEMAAERDALESMLPVCASAALIESHGRLRMLDREQGSAAPALRAALVEALVQMRRELDAEPLSEAVLQRIVPGSAPATGAASVQELDAAAPVASPSN